MSDGALRNADLAPVPPTARTWSAWSIAALWIGMAVCIPTYMLAASMIAEGMTWWQATLTVLLGNAIVLVPMVLNGHGGTKYGVPFPVLVRSSYGIAGAHLPSIARALVACGWFGIQCWVGGWSIYIALGALGAIDLAADTSVLPVLGITAKQLLCFLAFWAANTWIAVRGLESIRVVEQWAAPFLLACGVALLGWAWSSAESTAQLFAPPAKTLEGSDFWRAFFPQLTAMVGFWATLSLNIPDFTRYAKSQRAQALGQALGLPPTMTLFCFIGIVVTNATVVRFGHAIWDPIELIRQVGSPIVVFGALVALAVATLSTNIAANVVSPANGFSNLSPKRISFRMGALAACLIGLLIFPWRLYNDLGAYIFTWLIGYSALLGPIAGVMLCDYFVIRRTELDADALYDAHGPYRGVRWGAVAATLIAVVPNVPGFVNAATQHQIFPAVFDTIYGYAWFTGLAIGAALHLLFHALSPHRTHS